MIKMIIIAAVALTAIATSIGATKAPTKTRIAKAVVQASTCCGMPNCCTSGCCGMSCCSTKH